MWAQNLVLLFLENDKIASSGLDCIIQGHTLLMLINVFCGYRTLSVTLREEYKFGVFEKKVSRSIYGS